MDFFGLFGSGEDKEEPTEDKKLENQEKSVILRPVRFHYLMNIQDEKLEEAWNNRKSEALNGLKREILSKSGLAKFFDKIDLTDYTEPETPQGWNEIKITCTHPKSVKDNFDRSNFVSTYTNILEGVTDGIKSSSKLECKLSYFGLMKQSYPAEPEKMIPPSMLDPVMKKAWKMIDEELEEFKTTEWFKENYHRNES